MACLPVYSSASNSVLVIDIDTVCYFRAAQSTAPLNNLNIYLLSKYLSGLFVKEVSTNYLKILSIVAINCSSLFFIKNLIARYLVAAKYLI